MKTTSAVGAIGTPIRPHSNPIVKGIDFPSTFVLKGTEGTRTIEHEIDCTEFLARLASNPLLVWAVLRNINDSYISRGNPEMFEPFFKDKTQRPTWEQLDDLLLSKAAPPGKRVAPDKSDTDQAVDLVAKLEAAVKAGKGLEACRVLSERACIPVHTRTTVAVAERLITLRRVWLAWHREQLAGGTPSDEPSTSVEDFVNEL